MESVNKISPCKFRSMVRQGQLKGKPTTFVCKGFKQANLVILPQQHSQEFCEFSRGNAGALPLLYMSQPGEFGAPKLCKDSDVRTDVPSYNKFVNGAIESLVDNLLEFDLSKYVTFYLGCSFSFNDILLSNEILKENQKNSNVSMFVSSVDCYKCGPFNCKMVVSMRAIHKSNLSLTATVCESLLDVHGAPINYGNPKAIGIDDPSKFDFGELTQFKEDEVPVFWCCGVTGVEALKSAQFDLAFTHYPGNMFVTDVPQENIWSKSTDNAPPITSHVIEYNEKSSCYSSLSQETLLILQNIYSVVQQDLGNRGIKNLVVDQDFVKSALALSHASSVALITGFPVHDHYPPDETDGLPGIISLAAVLQSLGKRVVLFVDDNAVPLNEKIVQRLVDEKILKKPLSVVPYIAEKTHLKDKDGSLLYDVVLASERVGQSADGKYYSMRGKDLTSRVNFIDIFFREASSCADVTTISIGDGGNELGMGKVYDMVCTSIPDGEKIGCVVAADLLVTAGVSNWGCYGLGLALYALRACSVHDRYHRRAVGFPVDAFKLMEEFLPSVHRERKTLEVVEDFGIKDGVKPDQKLSVDGMLFDREHSKILTEMRKFAKLN